MTSARILTLCCVLYFIVIGLLITFPYPPYGDRPAPDLDCEPRLVGFNENGEEVYGGWDCVQIGPYYYPDVPTVFGTSEIPMIRGTGSPDYRAFVITGIIGLAIVLMIVVWPITEGWNYDSWWSKELRIRDPRTKEDGTWGHTYVRHTTTNTTHDQTIEDRTKWRKPTYDDNEYDYDDYFALDYYVNNDSEP